MNGKGFHSTMHLGVALGICLCPSFGSALTLELLADPGYVMSSAGFLGIGAVMGSVLARRAATPPGDLIQQLSSIRVRPGNSEHGVGLIVVQDVPTGGRVIGCEPVHSQTVLLSEIAHLPAEVRQTIHEMFDGVDEPPGTCTIPSAYEDAIPVISFLNHSPDPNCAYDSDQHAIVALRRLHIGEEATVNYFSYQEPETYTYRHAAAGFSDSFVLAELERSGPNPS
jgi:hypothetical protein